MTYFGRADPQTINNRTHKLAENKGVKKPRSDMTPEARAKGRAGRPPSENQYPSTAKITLMSIGFLNRPSKAE